MIEVVWVVMESQRKGRELDFKRLEECGKGELGIRRRMFV